MGKNEINKEKIEEYLRNLSDLNNQINNLDEDNVINDSEFVMELNRVLLSLGKDIKESMTNQEIKIPALNIKIKKSHPNAVIPSYSREGDAGLDLTITEILSQNINSITYGFGISIEIPIGYVGLLFPRSSIRNFNIMLSNCVGIIDSGFRGEIQSTFKYIDFNKILNKYNVGDRAAQIIILPYPRINFIEDENLSETERGSGGFGHTGT